MSVITASTSPRSNASQNRVTTSSASMAPRPRAPTRQPMPRAAGRVLGNGPSATPARQPRWSDRPRPRPDTTPAPCGRGLRPPPWITPVRSWWSFSVVASSATTSPDWSVFHSRLGPFLESRWILGPAFAEAARDQGVQQVGVVLEHEVYVDGYPSERVVVTRLQVFRRVRRHASHGLQVLVPSGRECRQGYVRLHHLHLTSCGSGGLGVVPGAVEVDHDRRFVADDSGVVAARQGRKVSGPCDKLGAVVHANTKPPADVVLEAPCWSRVPTATPRFQSAARRLLATLTSA